MATLTYDHELRAYNALSSIRFQKFDLRPIDEAFFNELDSERSALMRKYIKSGKIQESVLHHLDDYSLIGIYAAKYIDSDIRNCVNYDWLLHCEDRHSVDNPYLDLVLSEEEICIAILANMAWYRKSLSREFLRRTYYLKSLLRKVE